MQTVVNDGLAGLTVRAICVRAQASEAEFHDLWSDEWGPLIAAIDDFARLPVLPDTGRLLDDLVALVRDYRLHCQDPTYAAAFFYLMNELPLDAELARRMAPGFRDRRRRSRTLIERAVTRGELAADIDGHAILDGVLALGVAWMGRGHIPGDPEIRLAVEPVLAAARAGEPGRKREAKSTNSDSYRLYLFEPRERRRDRSARAQSVRSLSDGEAIAKADSTRKGRYAELWKEDQVIKIFEAD